MAEVADAWHREEHIVFLDSADTTRGRARWSILGIAPSLVFRSKRGQCWSGPPGAERPLDGAPLDELDALLRGFAIAPFDLTDAEALALPFRGGALGYLGYELLYQIEDVNDLGADDLAVDDCHLGVYETALIEDDVAQATYIVANGFGSTPEDALDEAGAHLGDMLARLEAVPPRPATPTLPARPRRRLVERDLTTRGISTQLPEPAYLEVVERAKEHIRAGDVFEICTTNRFVTTHDAPGHVLFDALRRVNPAPFAAYLKLPGLEVMSSSPERFLRRDRDGWVESCPIKGTRPRGATPAEDEALRDDLAASEKDRAENIMIVDLARNDLGRVCELGSVTVPSLLEVHSFTFTHQMISTVRGKVRVGVGLVDLLRAAFPGGSMTGAPKVEAMKIIDRLEPVKRGVFSGSIGYVDFEGAFDLSIVIRTFVKRGSTLSFHVGGAIVSDSDARDEHQEILDKAAGLLRALEQVDLEASSHRGLDRFAAPAWRRP